MEDTVGNVDRPYAYAETDFDVWQAIRTFNELEVVNLSEIDPEDRTCSICMQPYEDPENGGVLHIPVRLPCAHVFGKECLAQWLTPLGAWKYTMDAEWERAKGWFETELVHCHGSTDCPLCRRELFPRVPYAESFGGLVARVLFFDLAYEKVGCGRSQEEERSRADLMQYIEFNRRCNGDILERSSGPRWDTLQGFICNAMHRLLSFVIREKYKNVMNGTENLTQAQILQNLHTISRWGLEVDLDSPPAKPAITNMTFSGTATTPTQIATFYSNGETWALNEDDHDDDDETYDVVRLQW
ncbi:hypothetical protein MMC07_004863 [Pseudocyphellaria aurata]|nr:hypothetical protein [Pseudocyphellaria aurata]